ncbi:DEKNAAC104115 [Brettanomyces naardenensis]|uniref:DEKNAAC104115 n=1 Tax=Brettanomyces naardenensis TaxID=13370 RepID=A0A448YPZ7_BRENA|nr:DEKNAAC104115 [Brettanomyces naardenensis]
MSLFTTITTPNNVKIEQPLGLFIDNEWVKTEQTIDVIDPSTGKKITSVFSAGSKEVDLAVDAANKAFTNPDWSDLTGSERGDYLYKFYEIIKRDAAKIASIESLNNGKPYEAECLVGDIVETYEVFKYYAGWSDKHTGQFIGSQVLGRNKICYVDPVPLGAVAGIVPWNFPFLMMAWKIAPALATGNTLVMKSSEITPLTALYYGKIALEAGLPKGVLNIISGYGKDAGAALSLHPKLAKIAFTGSTATGKKIMESAGSSNMKKVSLECGGKSPFIIFDDCDMESVLEWAYSGIFYNKGEVCTSTSRFYVQDKIYDEFITKFVEYTEKNSVVKGPFEKGCTIGPLVSDLQYAKVKKYVDIGKKEGAKLVTGEFIDGPGYFCKPFIFVDCNEEMTIMKDEIFGPVVAISKFSTVEEVIKKANNTTYGLAAALFSNNITKAHNVASKLQAGMVWINSNGDSDIHVPFGGDKMSGIGRELGSYALDLFTQQRAIHVNLRLPY